MGNGGASVRNFEGCEPWKSWSNFQLFQPYLSLSLQNSFEPNFADMDSFAIPLLKSSWKGHLGETKINRQFFIWKALSLIASLGSYIQE